MTPAERKARRERIRARNETRLAPVVVVGPLETAARELDKAKAAERKASSDLQAATARLVEAQGAVSKWTGVLWEACKGHEGGIAAGLASTVTVGTVEAEAPAERPERPKCGRCSSPLPNKRAKLCDSCQVETRLPVTQSASAGRRDVDASDGDDPSYGLANRRREEA